MKKNVFITGIAGFIGFHLALALKKRGDEVFGCDNFNAYYSPALKREREQILRAHGIPVEEIDLLDLEKHKASLEKRGITHFVHLAAQAGVRYSLEAPQAYIQSNVAGFVAVLEVVKTIGCLLVFASSSSVYGENRNFPFRESDPTDLPASLYGATKKSGELLATSYHHLYGIKTCGLRYFTVYGPWGRPDMAYFQFAQAIAEGKPIRLFNQGEMERDFTYIDDIVHGTICAIDREIEHGVFNLARGESRSTQELIWLLEKLLGKKAEIVLDPMQKGDVKKTFADISQAKMLLGYRPSTSLEEGVGCFAEWFLQYKKNRRSTELQTADFVHN